jgi:hypothetical protein
MKKAFLLIILSAYAPIALAYNPIPAEPSVQYENIVIDGDPYVEHNFLGTLKDAPHTLVLKTEVSMTFTATVFQKSTGKPIPFGLMFVRQNDTDGGVTEVERKNAQSNEWSRVRDSGLGVTLLRGSSIRHDIGPGIYKLEVSTPDNKGDYMLVVGEEPASRLYFQTLSDVARIQWHFGYTPFHLPLSSYVYYPVGILGMLLIFALRYRARYLEKNRQYVRFTH